MKRLFQNRQLFIWIGMFVIVGGVLFVIFQIEDTMVVERKSLSRNSIDELPSSIIPEPTVAEQTVLRLRIRENSAGFLNVRKGFSQTTEKIGTVQPGEMYEYTAVQNNWYHILIPEKDEGWVSGEYIQVIENP